MHWRRAAQQRNTRTDSSSRCSYRKERISEARGVEGFGKKIRHANGFRLTFEIGEDDGDIAAKLPNELAASAAGRGQRVRVGDDSNRIEAAFAFADGFENGHALGADGEPVRGVF